MPRGEPVEEHAILLRLEERGEADRRLALLGEDRGLFWVTAKGARKSRRRLVGVTEPFTRGTFRTTRYGKGEFLDSVEVMGRRDRIPQQLGRYYVACYVCEAASRVLRVGHPAPEVFDLVRGLLDDMQESPEPHHMLWRALFEAGVLEIQGLFPELDPTIAPEAAWLEYGVAAGAWFPGVAPTPTPTPTSSVEPEAPAPRRDLRVGQRPARAPEPERARRAADAGPRLEVSRDAWELFAKLRQLPVATAREHEPDLEVLRPLNRFAAVLFRYHLGLDLKSAGLLNGFQRQELAKAAAAG